MLASAATDSAALSARPPGPTATLCLRCGRALVSAVRGCGDLGGTMRLFVAFILTLFAARTAAAADYWYYCNDSHAYYPYVTSCASQWRQVSVQEMQEQQRELDRQKAERAKRQAEAKAKAAELAAAKAAGYNTVEEYRAAQEVERQKREAAEREAAEEAERQRRAAAESQAALRAGYPDTSSYRAAQAAKSALAQQARPVTYEDLARYPEQHRDQIIQITGRVVQAVYDGGGVMLRIDLAPGSYATSSVVLVSYRTISSAEPRILEGDLVRILGSSEGLTSYESIFHQTIQAPQINARFVDHLGPGQT